MEVILGDKTDIWWNSVILDHTTLIIATVSNHRTHVKTVTDKRIAYFKSEQNGTSLDLSSGKHNETVTLLYNPD